MSEYRIPIGFTDLRAAVRQDMACATSEGFKGVAQRAAEVLAQLDEGDAEMTAHGGPWVVEIVLTHRMED